jgi:hypothetical protein
VIHELYCEISVVVFCLVDEDDGSEFLFRASVCSLLFFEKRVNVFNCQVLPAQLWLEAKFWQRMNVRWKKAWREEMSLFIVAFWTEFSLSNI